MILEEQAQKNLQTQSQSTHYIDNWLQEQDTAGLKKENSYLSLHASPPPRLTYPKNYNNLSQIQFPIFQTPTTNSNHFRLPILNQIASKYPLLKIQKMAKSFRKEQCKIGRKYRTKKKLSNFQLKRSFRNTIRNRQNSIVEGLSIPISGSNLKQILLKQTKNNKFY